MKPVDPGDLLWLSQAFQVLEEQGLMLVGAEAGDRGPIYRSVSHLLGRIKGHIAFHPPHGADVADDLSQIDEIARELAGSAYDMAARRTALRGYVTCLNRVRERLRMRPRED